MSKGLIDIITDKIVNSIFDEKWVGARGEKLTERELNLVRLLGRNGKVLRNIYVPKDGDETSEIDVIFITEKGLFVIESKNYSGWIFGNEKDGYWTASLGRTEKHKFYNPIKQNRTHIKWLREYLKDDIPMFNLIVFSERCELKNVTVENDEIKVIKRDRVYKTVRDIWNDTESVLDESQTRAIVEKLEKLTNADEVMKQAHIESIQKRFKKGEAKEAGQDVKGTDKSNTKLVAKIDSLQEKQPDNKYGAKQDTAKSVQVDSEVGEKCGTKTVEKSLSTEEIAETLSTEEMICPRCGAKLVKRIAKKGDNAGNEFWGCSAFPKCRYVKDV